MNPSVWGLLIILLLAIARCLEGLRCLLLIITGTYTHIAMAIIHIYFPLDFVKQPHAGTDPENNQGGGWLTIANSYIGFKINLS